MNFALPATLILIFALPGIIFRETFLNRAWDSAESPLVKEPLPEKIAWSLGISAIFHAIWSYISKLFGYTINYKAILAILGVRGTANADFPSVYNYPLEIFIYNLSIFFAAWLAGYISHRVIRYFHFDIKYRLFRFDSPWLYLLSGEKASFGLNKYVPVDVVFVSFILEKAGTPYIYCGMLEEYIITNGLLDRVVIKAAYRRKMENDKDNAPGKRSPKFTESEHYYRIEGDYFIVKYNEIRTLNIEYFYLEEENTDRESK